MYEYDLIISGGGIKYFYMIGIKILLDILDKNRILRINKYSAISSGAVFIVIMACKIDSNILFKKYKKYIKIDKINRLSKITILRLFLSEILPNNSHLICNNKVYITTTNINYFPRKETFFKYKSKEDLIDKIICSVSFPYFINKKFYYTLNNNKYIDGCFSINTPVFKNKNQIIIKPFFIGSLNLFSLECIDSKIYIYKGFNDMKNHLLGFKIISIQWYNKKTILERLIEYFIYIIKIIIKK